MNDPIVIGGTGGSGTRLVCGLIRHAGVFMGADLNYALDALPMSNFDDAYLGGGRGLDETLEECLFRHRRGMVEGSRWGWKHTRSYFTLWMLHKFFPRMYFVHVLRDGRDIAYAPNISLPTFWTGTMPDVKPNPMLVMMLWATTNMQAANYGGAFLEHYYQVRFEDICQRPEETIRGLYDFLGLDGDVKGAVPLMKKSLPSLGRWRGREGVGDVTAIGGEALKRFGYL